MRQELVHTHRHYTSQSQAMMEVIPRNDRMSSPRQDKSLEKRSKSLRSSDLTKMFPAKTTISQIHSSLVLSSSRAHITQRSPEISPQMRKSMSQFISDIEKLKSQNRQLVSENQLLFKQNQMIRNSMEHEVRQSKFLRDSECSINEQRNGYLESYYTRIKAIEERVEYYEAESKANEMYSNCLLEISKCLSSDELPIYELKSKIMNLMMECKSYKQEIERLDELCRTKEHNTNEELQKIIMDFNETVFIKNELEIKIFDLTTENNSLRTNIYELNAQVQAQLLEIEKINQFNSLNINLSTSQYHHPSDASEGHQQLKLNYEHLQRENQHLKLQIATYNTKIQYHNGSEFNHKQEIIRLNNFIAELNTKWNVEFEHNGVLQEERSNHLREIQRLELEIQRISGCLEEVRRNEGNTKSGIDMISEQKRGLEREIEMMRSEVSRYREGKMEMSSYNENLESEVKELKNQLMRLGDTSNELNRINQNKENNYLHELNSLRQTINKLKHQCQVSNQSLISKEEQIVSERESAHRNSLQALEYFKSEARMEIEKERSNNRVMGQKLRELESRMERMHRQGLQQESQLSSKRIMISDLENTVSMKQCELDEKVRRVQTNYNLEMERQAHNRSLLEGELVLSKNHIKELEQSVYKLRQAQLGEKESISANNANLQRRIEEYQLTLQNMRNRILGLESVELDKNRLSIEYNRLQRQLNNRSMEVQMYMKKNSDEQSLRRECYEKEISSLHEIIKRGEEENRAARNGYESQISSLIVREKDLQSEVMRQTVLLEQETRSESQLRGVIAQLKRQYESQLEVFKSELIRNMDWKQKEKSVQNNNKTLELENKIKMYEGMLNQISIEKAMKSNKDQQISQKNMFQFQMVMRENENLKLTNNKLATLLNTNQQSILALRGQLSAWSNRYDKLKSESQFHEEALNQQIKTLRLSLLEVEKHNVQLGTKATFNEHDRTIDRMTSMQDLNRSVVHNNLYFNETARNVTNNPEIMLVDQAHRLRTISNRVVERAGSPSTQIVVNVVQKNFEEEQRMVQPSNSVKSPMVINRNVSIKNDKSFNILPLIMNQEPTSPTQRFCFPKRSSVSPPLVRVQDNKQAIKHNKNQSMLFERSEDKKIKQIPYVPIERPIYSPRTNVSSNTIIKPLSPPVNSTCRMSNAKAQGPLNFSNAGLSPKATSPNGKQGKLNVTLLHNNSLIDKHRDKSRELPKSPPPSNNSDMRYCC